MHFATSRVGFVPAMFMLNQTRMQTVDIKQEVSEITSPPNFLTLYNIAVINFNHSAQKLLKGYTQTDRQKGKYFTQV
jgi:hypothetical protein